jgi:hypothetical protein
VPLDPRDGRTATQNRYFFPTDTGTASTGFEECTSTDAEPDVRGDLFLDPFAQIRSTDDANFITASGCSGVVRAVKIWITCAFMTSLRFSLVNHGTAFIVHNTGKHASWDGIHYYNTVHKVRSCHGTASKFITRYTNFSRHGTALITYNTGQSCQFC